MPRSAVSAPLGDRAATAALGQLAKFLFAEVSLGPPCEPPREPIEVVPHTRLLTSLGGPILDRLDLPARVQKIELVAPFVDANASVFNEVAGRWPGAEIRLRVDQRFGSLSEDLIRDAQRLGLRARLEVLRLGDEDNSTPLVHGKLFAWLSDTEATVVVGSANLSRPALKGGGNFEAVLEHRTGVAQAEALARVPRAKWHRAKPEHAGNQRPLEPARPHPVGALLAECRGRQLSLSWSGRAPEGHLVVRVHRGSLTIYEAAVPTPHQLGGRFQAVLDLPAGVLPDENAALRVELVSESRTVRAGWLELAEVLESPPEIRTRRRLLKEIFEDPLGCEPDDVVRLLELLRHDLDLVELTAPARVARHFVDAGVPEGDESVRRGELLESEFYPEDTSGRGAGFSELVERILDRATQELRIFGTGPGLVGDMEPGGWTAKGRHGTGDAGPTSSLNVGDVGTRARSRIAPGVPEAICSLYADFRSRIEAAERRGEILNLLPRVPTYLKALAYPMVRWRLSREFCLELMSELAWSCLGPGGDATIRPAGGLSKLTTTLADSTVEPDYLARCRGHLLALLLVLHAIGEALSTGIARDMLDAVEQGEPILERPEVRETVDLLWSLVGRPGSVPPDPAAVWEELVSHDGKMGVVRRRRAALRALFEEPGRLPPERFDILLSQAVDSEVDADRLRDGLKRLIQGGRKPRLEEIDLDDGSCPKCFTVLPSADFDRMGNGVFVYQHTCGTFLVRRLEAS